MVIILCLSRLSLFEPFLEPISTVKVCSSVFISLWVFWPQTILAVASSYLKTLELAVIKSRSSKSRANTANYLTNAYNNDRFGSAGRYLEFCCSSLEKCSSSVWLCYCALLNVTICTWPLRQCHLIPCPWDVFALNSWLYSSLCVKPIAKWCTWCTSWFSL